MKDAICKSWSVLFSGGPMTVAVLRNAEKQTEQNRVPVRVFSAASKCVWQLDSEA